MNKPFFAEGRRSRIKTLACVLFLIVILTPAYLRSGNDQPSLARRNAERIVDRFGMEFVLVPAGTFTMGSESRDSDEPPHSVEITKPFFLAVTELSDRQIYVARSASGERKGDEFGFDAWRIDLNRNRARKGMPLIKGDLPFSIASWNEADQLAETLSSLDADYNYRLPTEAEWEYACRGGTQDGFKLTPEVDVDANADESPIRTVRGIPPNRFGLYGMLGNLGEYCSDWYSEDFYTESPLRDPKGPANGTQRVIRGSRGESNTPNYGVSRRDHAIPNGDGNILNGVRFVLERVPNT